MTLPLSSIPLIPYTSTGQLVGAALFNGVALVLDGVGVVSGALDTFRLFADAVDGLNESEIPLTHLPPSNLAVTHPMTMGTKAFNRLVNDINENGINEPIKFIEHDGVNYVVDGNHRLVAARSLNFSNAPVEKVELPYLVYRSIDDLDFYSPGF